MKTETATPERAAIPDSKSKAYSNGKDSDNNLICKIFDYLISVIFILFMFAGLILAIAVNFKIIQL